MQNKLDLGNHSVYSLHYHFIQCVKYRRKALTNPLVVDVLKIKIHSISETFDVEQCRCLYNFALAERKEAWKTEQRSVKYMLQICAPVYPHTHSYTI
ncbi:MULTISPECIES: transposase [unclassified Methanosarcina]|uniref:transposase n=1 Tax=unclassified Methanosarcina TaxID=2644672 RepID=UPI000A7DE6C5